MRVRLRGRARVKGKVIARGRGRGSAVGAHVGSRHVIVEDVGGGAEVEGA